MYCIPTHEKMMCKKNYFLYIESFLLFLTQYLKILPEHLNCINVHGVFICEPKFLWEWIKVKTSIRSLIFSLSTSLLLSFVRIYLLFLLIIDFISIESILINLDMLVTTATFF